VNPVSSVLRRFVFIDNPSPIVKQLPTAVVFVAAVLLVGVVPDIPFTSIEATIAALACMILATVLAVVFGVKPSLAQLALIVPCIDLLAIGLLRMGTGGTTSLFGGLIILPVIWIANKPERRYIFFAGAGASLALTLPYTLGGVVPQNSSDWLRGFITPIIYAVAAAIVNEMSRQGIERVAAIHELVDERDVMLRGAVDYAERLSENEDRLRAADRLTRSVLDAVTEQSVIGSDVTGLIDVWNPGAEKMLGLKASQTQGRRYVHEFHVETELLGRSRELNYPPGETVLNPGFSALVESARLGKAEVRQWTYVRADGTTLTVELAVTRRVDDQGATVGYIFVATDVTQALEVSRLKDEFVGLISHELRTPLSSILGYLELMRDDEENPLSDEQVQYLGVAERNAHRLLRLVGDLLFTAQVGSSTFSLDTSLIEVRPIVNASVESATPNADTAGVSLSSDMPKKPILVLGDAQRLGQAVDNLISNAIKFTPRGGSVNVEVTIEGKSVVIKVTDTGMGIPEDELDQLFARFFRASTATRAAVPGVGLGLSITKAIIVAHHGELDVQSVVGKGTSFIIRLPLNTAAPVSA
jgi:signal transduction histidine kinase